MVVRRPGDDDGAEQLTCERAGELIRPKLLGNADLLLGHEEEQAEQLGLDRGHRLEDVPDRQGVRRREHRIGRDACRAIASTRADCREPPLQGLAQHPLVDAGDMMHLLECLVAAKRIGDVADRQDDRIDERDPPRRGLEIVSRGMVVDQVFDERLGPRDRRLPGRRVVSDDLVRVLAFRQPGRRARPRLPPLSSPWVRVISPASAVTPTVPAFSQPRSTS